MPAWNNKTLAAIPVCCLATIAVTAAHAADPADPPPTGKDTILILDASGSMWGQIDGVNKIVIAKDVVEGLMHNLPASQRLGFVAYGHRRKGDCADIETLAEVGAARDKMIDALRELSPQGKTPLSASVQHAATALDYQRNAATVILVSDGLETCDADPCALARTLKKNGLDFTVHVVGFDVTEQERAGLECIATETGGQFLSAANAGELNDALRKVTVQSAPAPAEPVPSQVVLKATILSGGPQIQSKMAWRITPVAGGDPVYQATDAGVVKTAILPGVYRVDAAWSGWRDGTEKSGYLDITIEPQNTHVYTIPIDLGLPVSLESSSETAEGVPITVSWSGPDDLGTTVSVNRLDDDPHTAIYFFPGQKIRKVHQSGDDARDTDGDGDIDQFDVASSLLAAPTTAGTYEVRYTLRSPMVILARRPLTVTDSQYRLSAPAEAPVSTRIDIDWEGPLTDGDIVTMLPAGDARDFDNARYTRLHAGKPAGLTTPKEPGNYEIRYVMYGGYTTYPGMAHAVQTSIPITVTDVTASIDAPDTAVGGSTIELGWKGPPDDWEDDYISIVEKGAVKPNRDSRAPVATRGEALNPAPIRVPAIEGDYEAVYLIIPGDRIISRTPITITRAQATVDAPDTVKAGQDFEIPWSGDAFGGDRVVVVASDYPDVKMWGVTLRYGFNVDADHKTGTVRGEVVAKPGEYEARYVTGLQHQVLARDKFVVTE